MWGGIFNRISCYGVIFITLWTVFLYPYDMAFTKKVPIRAVFAIKVQIAAIRVRSNRSTCQFV